MPLNPGDRKLLETIDRMKVYLLVIAGAVLIHLLLVPSDQIQMVTSVLGIALCGIFWLTQRLLSFVTQLDHELTRLVNAVKGSLTEEERKRFF